MANLKQWILKIADGEKVEAVVIGEMGGGDYGKNAISLYDEMPKGKVIPWGEAGKWLDYDFDDGYDALGCQAVFAWTANKIIAIGTYEGSTWPYSMPRNPIDIMPKMEGG